MFATCAFLFFGCGQGQEPHCASGAIAGAGGHPGDSVENLLPEPTDWIDVGLVLDTGSFGSWDAIMEGITPAAIVQREGQFFLYYVGSDDYVTDLNNIGPAHRAIGVAVSQDGLHWTKPSANPVLTFSATGNPEEGAVSAGMFVDPDGTFLAYYGANIAPNPNASYVAADVRLATSSDGIRFEKIGKVIDHTDRSVWGHGDEIHSTLALRHGSTTYVYYVPNGTPQKRTLGYCRGSTWSSLSDCGPVTDGSGPIRSAGPSSVTQMGPDLFAFFIQNGNTLDVYSVDAGCLTSFPAPLRSYSLNGGAVVTLDRARRTWFWYTGKWSHIELKVAPAGMPDASPPTAPAFLTADSPRYDRAILSWGEASDPDTGVLSYNVYRDGANIGTSRDREFRDSMLAERTTYHYEVRAVNLHGLEGAGSPCTVRTSGDTEPPSITSVSAVAAGEVLVEFSEPVSEVVAALPARYVLDGGVDVIRAAMGGDSRTVLLGTTAMDPGGSYTLTVTGILDRAATPNRGSGARVFTASRVPGLLGYWSMDDVGSAGSDRSGSGHRATVFGEPESVPGRVAGALGLDGDDYLELVPTRALDDAARTDFTVTAWVRPAGAPPATDNTNAAYAVFSGPGGLQLRYRFDEVFVAAIGTSNERFELVSGKHAPDDWHHVAMVLNAGRNTLALYVDGEPVKGSPLALPGSRAQKIWESPKFKQYHGRYRIGVGSPRFSLESNYFRGALDEVRVHRRALGRAELRELLQAP